MNKKKIIIDKTDLTHKFMIRGRNIFKLHIYHEMIVFKEIKEF